MSEGFTQEFFIEGGRSRTGKTLAPRFGMLSWNVQAFVASERRDLFFVPVAITYERLVEEGSMIEELEGGEKKAESMLGLLRARKVLSRRFGSVFVNFGEPISLAQALDGPRPALERGATKPSRSGARSSSGSGNELAERINWAMVANATSVAAAALLGERAPRHVPPRARGAHGAAGRPAAPAGRAAHAGAATPTSRTTSPTSIDFLLRARTDSRREGPARRDPLLRGVEPPRARRLPQRAVPLPRGAELARAPPAARLGLGSRAAEHVTFWLDLFYAEFFVPTPRVLAEQFDAFLDYFESAALERFAERLRATEKGRSLLALPRRADARAARGLLRRRVCSAGEPGAARHGEVAREARARRTTAARSCWARCAGPRAGTR